MRNVNCMILHIMFAKFVHTANVGSKVEFKNLNVGRSRYATKVINYSKCIVFEESIVIIPAAGKTKISTEDWRMSSKRCI